VLFDIQLLRRIDFSHPIRVFKKIMVVLHSRVCFLVVCCSICTRTRECENSVSCV